MMERRPGKIELDIAEPLTSVNDIVAAQDELTQRQPSKVDAPTEPLQTAPPEITATKRRAKKAKRLSWGKAVGVAAGVFVLWLLVDLALSVQQLFTVQPVLASVLGVLSATAVGLLAAMAVKEWRSVKQADQTELRQQAIAKAVAENNTEQLLRLLEPLLAQLPEAEAAQFVQEAKRRMDAASSVQLAENTWLAECDRQAQQLINHASLTVAGAVAVVPHPVFDGVVVLWRAVKLVKEIGEIYGLQPTGLSAWRLFKHALVSAVMSAGIETAGDVFIEELGRGAFESAGKRVAEGAVMMLRLKRLGNQAQQLCRPWPAQAD